MTDERSVNVVNVDEYDKMGVKPAAMLIALRENAIKLPVLLFN